MKIFLLLEIIDFSRTCNSGLDYFEYNYSMDSEQSDLWMPHIDTVRSFLPILYTLGIAESLQPHSERMHSYIRHDFNRPGYLISWSIALRSKKTGGVERLSYMLKHRSRDHRDYHI